MKGYGMLFIAAAVAGGVLGPGCSTYRDRATGETATYACERLKTKLDLEIGTVYAAAKRAAVDLRLKVARTAQDGISGEIRATNAQHESVEICLGAVPENRTIVTIRVGPYGDRKKSIVIFERMMEELSQAQQVAVAPTLQWDKQPTGPAKPSSR
jgi:hypothetical protein